MGESESMEGAWRTMGGSLAGEGPWREHGGSLGRETGGAWREIVGSLGESLEGEAGEAKKQITCIAPFVLLVPGDRLANDA
jgi:hypothetical protein